MIEEQPIIAVTPETLLEKVREMHDQGHRLVQIGTTPLKDIIEVNYSFDKDGRFVNLRVQIPGTGAVLPSISGIFWCAFIYENEMHDLFNIQVDGIAIDFKGKFYQTAVKFPFACKAPETQPAPAAAATSA